MTHATTVTYEAMANTNKVGTATRWYIGSYRHLQPLPKANLYYEVRRIKGLSVSRIAPLFGVSYQAWRYRERTKRMYHAAEIMALWEFSGLSAKQFMELVSNSA